MKENSGNNSSSNNNNNNNNLKKEKKNISKVKNKVKTIRSEQATVQIINMAQAVKAKRNLSEQSGMVM